ncbi:MATE family efflux transporter [Coprococcus comes]|uniref:MATE family efflux transporter n=1 Tax=Coprococcus comes TaxID=410072 RepID=UPI00156FCB11|nr:MATE family efflux transporter [Coprococcus comes]MCB6473784.1 MATE family efflux transporter [Coprococcus comes]NSC16022.1 MATE family efflux transporter [Coprococcus comes]NSC19118.1 MATE family efflux transporter [Coprococcus comes]NSC31378.1 MATE family efflux transporter [Coprococcus comes]NSC69003.1 MATE family efflux transporter [Coprococcus comes]
MSNESTKTNQITEGVIWKQLLIFFFPIVVGTLFQQLYNTVDAVIVGRFVGKGALAAVGGSSAVLSNLIIGCFTGLASGASVIVSQFYGAKDERNLQKSLHTAYAFSVILSIVFTILGWALTPFLLKLIDTPTDTLADSILYLRIYFLGIFGTLIFNIGSAIMRSIGDSRRPLYYLIVCCFLNIILDLVLVIVFDMGIVGAAIATIISQAVSAILVTNALMKKYDDCKLYLSKLHIDLLKLRMEFRIGIPSALQAFMYSITNIIIQAAINGFGTDTAAAWASFGKLDALFWTVNGAFGIAITTFAGQNYGAGKKERIFKSVRICLAMAVAVCGGIVLFLAIFCRPLFSIFTTDQNVINIGIDMLRFMAPCYTIYVFIEVLSGALRGTGDVLLPTLITLGGVCLIRIPWIMFVLPAHHTTTCVMLSYPISWITTTALIIPYYLYRKKHAYD